MKSVRESIMDAVAEALSQVTMVNGFNTNAGARIFRYRDLTSEPFQPEELECFNVRETQEQAKLITSAVHEYILLLEITGLTAAQDYTLDRLYALRADAIMALGRNPTLNDQVFLLQMTGTDMIIETQAHRTGAVKIMLDARYRTPNWDPYTVFTTP